MKKCPSCEGVRHSGGFPLVLFSGVGVKGDQPENAFRGGEFS